MFIRCSAVAMTKGSSAKQEKHELEPHWGKLSSFESLRKKPHADRGFSKLQDPAAARDKWLQIDAVEIQLFKRESHHPAIGSVDNPIFRVEFPTKGAAESAEKLSENKSLALWDPSDNSYDELPLSQDDAVSSLTDSQKSSKLKSILTPSLEAAFVVSEYPEGDREGLLQSLIDALLQHARLPEGSWASRVRAEARTPSLLSRVALPEKAPAIWRSDKQPGDTPPTFIKRHYGTLLRADASGLTRSDIRRLDPTLYMALSNWLRRNALPEDCPLPLRWERVDAEIAALQEAGIDEHTVLRIRSAQVRRENGP